MQPRIKQQLLGYQPCTEYLPSNMRPYHVYQNLNNGLRDNPDVPNDKWIQIDLSQDDEFTAQNGTINGFEIRDFEFIDGPPRATCIWQIKLCNSKGWASLDLEREVKERLYLEADYFKEKYGKSLVEPMSSEIEIKGEFEHLLLTVTSKDLTRVNEMAFRILGWVHNNRNIWLTNHLPHPRDITIQSRLVENVIKAALSPDDNGLTIQQVKAWHHPSNHITTSNGLLINLCDQAYHELKGIKDSPCLLLTIEDRSLLILCDHDGVYQFTIGWGKLETNLDPLRLSPICFALHLLDDVANTALNTLYTQQRSC